MYTIIISVYLIGVVFTLVYASYSFREDFRTSPGLMVLLVLLIALYSWFGTFYMLDTEGD